MMKTFCSNAKPRAGWSAFLLLILFPGYAASAVVDLTIEVAGDLLLHGGVVTVYPIRATADDWARGVGSNLPTALRLDARYTAVQLRYPEHGSFAYRFRTADTPPNTDRLRTQLLSTIGTDEMRRGPQMTMGFTNAYSTGGSIIRIPAAAEYIGVDEATRTDARWGATVGRDTPPPADERSARALEAIIAQDLQRQSFECTGGPVVQACTVRGDEWPRLEAQWWRALAEMRLERLQYYALRRCYDASTRPGARCEPNPSTNEPQFLGRGGP